MERTEVDLKTGTTRIVQFTAEEVADEEAKTALYNNVENRKIRLLDKCKADRDAKTYSNETVAFPADEHEIKTSNEVDIRNLVSKMLAATAIIQAGGGAGDYKYTTAAKVQVTMTVQQFSTAALSIMAIKDAIFYTYEDLRVLIEAATTTTALDNIVSDWPS